MLKMPRKMAVLGAMLAALLITGAALAQQTPPHSFYGFGGSVTIDGEPAPSGTTIMAMAGGQSVGSATYSAESGWSIGDVPAGTMGVTFTVNGMAAAGSYDTSAGGSTGLSLAVTATPDPHTFSGTATLDGAPATGSAAPADPDSLEGESGADDVTGAAIAAMAEGQDSVSATSDPSDGSWSLEVPGDTSGWTFTVNGEAAGEGPYEAAAGGSTTVTLALVSPTEPATDGDADEGDADGPTDGDDDAGTDDGSTDDAMMQDESGDDGTTDGSTDRDADEGDADEGASGMTAGLELGDPPGGAEPTGTVDDDSAMDSNGAMDGDESLDNGDDAGSMDSDGAMDEGDEGAMDEGDNEFPDTGTGGLADSSRGVSSAVYGGIAGALALIALAGGVAVRRRAQS